MILVLGGSGFIGGAYLRYFEQHGVPHRSVSRKELDYYDPDRLIALLRETQCEFLINAAGYTGKPNVDACEVHRSECLLGNAVLPGQIRLACEATNTPWGHVSSGCIYTGSPSEGTGFTEEDPPNFCFRTNNSSFYSGCKALGEECLIGAEECFVWRLRIPFDNIDSPRNYLTKLMRYDRLLEATNSISNISDFVRASFECWTRKVPFGIYNVTNSGFTTTREVVALVQKHLMPDKQFEFFSDEEEFMSMAAKTPRSNCVLDNSKLRATGIKMIDVRESIEESLKNWRSSDQ